MAPGDLARQQRCVEQIRARWPAFLRARQTHLGSHSVGQAPAEKVAENILCDLFTQVLDWTTEQARLQENLIDLTLTRLGVKYLIVEAKRPGSLDGPGGIGRAVRQACGYAEEHKVDKIAVSDGCVLEAYDLAGLRLNLRVRAHLSAAEPPESLWWLSTRGIYRTPETTGAAPPSLIGDDTLLHPKYQLPASCFAYVGHPQRASTWKLPYLEADGTVNSKRLPKAIQSVLRDYRGEQVRLPEEAVPDVLARLADAAVRQGRMPDQDPTPAPIYLALRDSLRQFARP
ncbi:MAG: hypothetical protein ACRDN0_28665 [Trebonia sp.]